MRGSVQRRRAPAGVDVPVEARHLQELVDLLDIPVEELVELLSDYITEKRIELEEFIQYGN